jgi:hypothetical protein
MDLRLAVSSKRIAERYSIGRKVFFQDVWIELELRSSTRIRSWEVDVITKSLRVSIEASNFFFSKFSIFRRGRDISNYARVTEVPRRFRDGRSVACSPFLASPGITILDLTIM